MIKSYILIALRNLRKQKAFSWINIFGMAVGMAGFILFALMAGSKLRADKFHEKAEQIYSVVQVFQNENKEDQHLAFTPGPMAKALRSEFPEIKDACRVYPAGQVALKRGEDTFSERSVLFVDPSFLSLFSFKMTAGDPETALSEPYSLVLSEASARKYFGDENPIGRVLTFNKDTNLRVTGVIKNITRTSSIKFDFLVSLETVRAFSGILDDWSAHRMATFLLVSDAFDRSGFEERLPDFLFKHFGSTPESPEKIYLFPFLDFRLKSRHITSFMGSSSPTSVYIIFSIGILLLLVVSINFVNLATVRSMHRTKEIGLRKVVGARRPQLILQFLGESLILSIIAIPLAVVLYEVIHPIFYASMGDFAMLSFVPQVSNSIWNYPFLLKYLVGAAVLTGLFSGLYPAFFLSSLQPLHVLKENFQPGRKKKRGSKAMIVFQFSLSILFISCAFLLKYQARHLFEADFGYNREKVAYVELGKEARDKLDVLKTEIARHEEVVHVSGAGSLPVVWESPAPVRLPDTAEDESVTMQAYGVDYGFVETLEIQMEKGRRFSRDFADADSLILTEAALEKLKWEHPIGRQLIVGGRTGTVVGVAEDFLFADIGFQIPPAVLYLEPDGSRVLLVRYSSEEGFPELRKYIKQQWVTLMPDSPFECSTLSDYFSRVFGLLGKLTGFLNMIGMTAILFSCLGLLGLTSYLTKQRTKEIGIRKVLGASAGNIMWRMTREFLILVAVANVIALGLVYFGWSKALQTGLLFITPINAGTYIMAVTVSLAAAFLAVLTQTLKAARTNPALSLRSE